MQKYSTHSSRKSTATYQTSDDSLLQYDHPTDTSYALVVACGFVLRMHSISSNNSELDDKHQFTFAVSRLPGKELPIMQA